MATGGVDEEALKDDGEAFEGDNTTPLHQARAVI